MTLMNFSFLLKQLTMMLSILSLKSIQQETFRKIATKKTKPGKQAEHDRQTQRKER